MTAVETQRPQLSSSYLPRSPVLGGSDPEAKRAEMAEYFTSVFDRYESLFDLLANDAAFYDKPIALRHPLIFYFGHTATFYTNKLVLAKLLRERIDPRLESICAVGVDEMSWDDLDDTHYEWPSVGEVRAYRQKVRA
ncbi:MAG: DinB family protein, partial [Pseudomonas sp.]|nr:DinB family protein [Pseudomonas sp.]